MEICIIHSLMDKRRMVRKHDEEPLLPFSAAEKETDEVKEHATRPSSVSFAFKCYVICAMTFVWAGYTLVVRYTRTVVPESEAYNGTTVVFLAESTKLVIALVMFFFEKKNFADYSKSLQTYFFGAPREFLKMSVPSIAYAVQNNLDIIALSNLDSSVYQVTIQLKVITTAIFMMLFLNRSFSGRRWLAIFMLFVGIAMVQLNSVSRSDSPVSVSQSYVKGMIAVLATCLTAGFAGVYFEMMLKNGETPFWIRNLQMYSCGTISAAIICYSKEGDTILTKGFFFGYNSLVVSIIALLSIGGIFISLVMKHLDNLYKSFASSFSIVIVVVVSFFLFDTVTISLMFVFGTAIVIGSLVLYNSVNE